MRQIIVALIIAGCGTATPKADRSYFEPSAIVANPGDLCGCASNFECQFGAFGCPNAGFICERIGGFGVGTCAPVSR